MNDKKFFAFVHIERTGGMTLNHILRRIFFLQKVEVRPFSKTSSKIFCAKDLKRILLVNPFIRCISGHTIRALSDLRKIVPNIKFITIVRKPIERYISHYLYLKYWLKNFYSFEEFIRNQAYSNLQTKIIAGEDSYYRAKTVLSDYFWLVGTTENFNEFLMLLQKEFELKISYLNYKRQNTSLQKNAKSKNEFEKIYSKYFEDIKERNKNDIELYNYARNEISLRQKNNYGSEFEIDFKNFQSLLNQNKPKMIRSYVDYIIRKTYYEPIFGTIRVLNGLPVTRKNEWRMMMLDRQ
jgi:hypothetical protein